MVIIAGSSNNQVLSNITFADPSDSVCYETSQLKLCDTGNLKLKGQNKNDGKWDELWKSPKPENTNSYSC